MILGPVSLLDSLVFVLFLIPQLLLHVPIFQLIRCLLHVFPFLVFSLPIHTIRDRYFKSNQDRPPFFRHASLFQEIVIRCVRYSFANLPIPIGRVFLSKWVVYPFLRFRMLRHGILRSPVQFEEIIQKNFKGLWITPDKSMGNDVAILYCHGGGFSMGSSYFYQEFLIAWIECLQDRGFKNPLVLAVEYTLVPDRVWPTQLDETRSAYQHLVSYMDDASKVCVSGDSAGASIILSSLLVQSLESRDQDYLTPGLAVLISPWTHLVSDLNQNTTSDYLDADSLHRYARQYSGSHDVNDPILSPGFSVGRWKQASPKHGFYFIYGREEVFAHGIAHIIAEMKREKVPFSQTSKDNGIHAWPVVNLFLGTTRAERLEGLNHMSDVMATCMGQESMTANGLYKQQHVD